MIKFLRLANDIASNQWLSPGLILFNVFTFVFCFLWTLGESAGIQGSKTIFLILFLVSLVIAMGLISIKVFKWQIMEYFIHKNLVPILSYQPKTILGIGYGGAIISALIIKHLQRKGIEETPSLVVLDRNYIDKEHSTKVKISGLCTLDFQKLIEQGNVLLVTAEVHGGNTLKKYRKMLDQNGVEHNAFTFLMSPTSRCGVDNYILLSDNRGILPWVITK